MSQDSYYGEPVLTEPVWTWEIPVYFFAGGLALYLSWKMLQRLRFRSQLRVARLSAGELKRRIGAGKPRRSRKPRPDSRHVARTDAREVWERDGRRDAAARSDGS